jgi:hydrogenase maturation factor HypF (carbamoyltransferase family)
MSVTGIASSILSTISGGSQSPQTRAQQIQSEFQQLGQDLQSGNLAGAQTDFTTLSQHLPGLSQNTTTATANNSLAQTFAQLGQDLQSGNLQASQQDFTTIQQDLQLNATQQAGGHHHHHYAESSQNSSANPIAQVFSQLEQTLQAGNLQGAQSAFSTLLNDLQQIGGLATGGSGNAAASTGTGSLNVTA